MLNHYIFNTERVAHPSQHETTTMSPPLNPYDPVRVAEMAQRYRGYTTHVTVNTLAGLFVVHSTWLHAR